MAHDGPAKRVLGHRDNIWVEFNALSREHKPTDLGQGFPDFPAPEFLTKALSEATIGKDQSLNQYTRGYGHPRLIEVLSKLYSELIGRKIDPEKEILVSYGADEAIHCAILGLVDPGDEVIIIEPFYDSYEPVVMMAEAKSVYVTLKPEDGKDASNSNDWKLDPEELASKFNEKTKMIILNNPNNPLGKVYSNEELTVIADLCKKHDVICFSDEVYEWFVYKGSTHERIATLPDMWERTITIGSAGKTFCVTGWKIGWAYGPKHLIESLHRLHETCICICPTPVQEAIAIGFELELSKTDESECFRNRLCSDVEAKKEKVVEFLKDAGMTPIVPNSGFFILADFSHVAANIDLSGETGTKDCKFAKWLIKNKKLQGIPPSSFYSVENQHLIENYIRFCFIKEDSTIEEAGKKIKSLQNS